MRTRLSDADLRRFRRARTALSSAEALFNFTINDIQEEYGPGIQSIDDDTGVITFANQPAGPTLLPADPEPGGSEAEAADSA